MSTICRWLHDRNAEQVKEVDDRAERTADVSARLRTQRRMNGFGRMFEIAFHAPPRREGKGS